MSESENDAETDEMKHDERQYVETCPVCGASLLGMDPAEYRSQHAPECDPLAGLYHFSGEK